MVNKKILITGAAGFIGSHLAEKLASEKSNKIFCLDKKIDKNSYFFIKGIKNKCSYKDIDLTQEKKVWKLIRKEKFNFIFHLAANAIVEEAYLSPKKTIQNNIISTLNILEAIRRFSPKTKIIVASSDKAYGKLQKKYREDDPLKGDHPYEVSKSCSEFVTKAYMKTYGIDTVVTRCANVYGEGDFHFNRLIPEIIKSIISEKKMIVRSNGKFKRDYIYVKDVVSAFISIMNKFDKVKGEELNISSNENYSVLEVIKNIEKSLGKKIPYKIINSQKNEIPNQSLNSNKITQKIHWKKKYMFKSVMPKIFKYYRKYVFSKNKN